MTKSTHKSQNETPKPAKRAGLSYLKIKMNKKKSIHKSQNCKNKVNTLKQDTGCQMVRKEKQTSFRSGLLNINNYLLLK